MSITEGYPINFWSNGNEGTKTLLRYRWKLSIENILKKSSRTKSLFFRQDEFLPVKLMRNWAMGVRDEVFIEGEGRRKGGGPGFLLNIEGGAFYPS